jgi:hypothetical protein
MEWELVVLHWPKNVGISSSMILIMKTGRLHRLEAVHQSPNQVTWGQLHDYYSILAECSATLRVFIKNSKKKFKKKIQNFFLKTILKTNFKTKKNQIFWKKIVIFFAIYLPQPIWGMPAKIWVV